MSPIPVVRQGRSNSSTGIKCHVCSREFSKNEHLKRHLRSHSKEKPYECTECKKLFVRRDTLSRHTKSHHGSVLPKKTTIKRKRATSTSGLDSLSATVYPVENVRHNSVVELYSGYAPHAAAPANSGLSGLSSSLPTGLESDAHSMESSIAAAAALAAVPPANSQPQAPSSQAMPSSLATDQLVSDSDGLNEYLAFLAHNFDQQPSPVPALWGVENSSSASSSGGDSPLALSLHDDLVIDEALSPTSRKPDLSWPPVFDFESDELYPRDGYKRRIVDDPLTSFQGISW